MSEIHGKPIDWSRKDQAVFEFWVDNCWHGYLAIRQKDWVPIIDGKSISIKGTGFCFDDIWYDDVWDFSGGLDGQLIMRYFLPCEKIEEGKIAFQGKPRDVLKRALPI